MSVDRISGKYEINSQYKNVSLGENEQDIDIFENNKTNETDIINNDISYGQVNMVQGTEETSYSAQETQLTQAITSYLENLVLGYEEQFASVKENNGWIAKGWDWFKNKTGIGAGSDKVQNKIDNLKKQIEELKKDSSKLNDVYKSVVGNELNEEELNNLLNGQVDLSNSEIVESVSKYTQGQKQCTNVISGIASGLTVVGLVAAGIVAAPFTGGISLGASAVAIGTLTAAGTAAYMVPQVIDGVTEKDGYSFGEVMEDLGKGVVNSTFTAVGMGAGKAVGSALSKTASKTLAGLAAGETSALIIGDGISVGNYAVEAGATRLDDLELTEDDKIAYEKIINNEIKPGDEEAYDKAYKYIQAKRNNSDLSLEGFGKTLLTSTGASLAAGFTAYNISSFLRPLLTSGTSAQSQIIGRLVSSGASGGGAGMSAAFVGGGTNYLLDSAINGKELTFNDWLNASTENILTAGFTGTLGGIAFEAVNIAAGTPNPSGTAKVQKGTTENGIKYKNYLDKNGNVIATDVSASELQKIYEVQNNNEQGLTKYENNNLTEGKVYNTARTIRFNYTELPGKTYTETPEGIAASQNYKTDATLFDWAGNSYYMGTGLVNENAIPNTNNNKNDVRYEYNTANSDAEYFDKGVETSQESALAASQNNTQLPNSQSIEIVDASLAQLSAIQGLVQNAVVAANISSAMAAASGSSDVVNSSFAHAAFNDENTYNSQISSGNNPLTNNLGNSVNGLTEKGINTETAEKLSSILTNEKIDLILKSENPVSVANSYLQKINNFEEILSEYGADANEIKLITSFMFKSAAWIDSDGQAAITKLQLEQIYEMGASKENTYVLAPQPNAKNNFKSYTNAARDIIEISQNTSLALDGNNARASYKQADGYYSFDLSQVNDDAFIIVSDDCSVTGNSIIEDTLNGLSASNGISGSKTICFTPTVLGDKASSRINEFIDCFDKMTPSEAEEIVKLLSNVDEGTLTVNKSDIAAMSENAQEMYKLISKITDFEAQPWQGTFGRVKILASNIKNLVENNANNQIHFKLIDGVEAKDYRLTDEYINLSPEEQKTVDYYLSGAGQSFGYGNNATLIAIEGYQNNTDIYNFDTAVTDAAARQALGIDYGSLPLKGNAPNNNMPLAREFAVSVGVSSDRVKIAGETTAEVYLDAASKGYTLTPKTYSDDGTEVVTSKPYRITLELKKDRTYTGKYNVCGTVCEGGDTIVVSYTLNNKVYTSEIKLPVVQNPKGETQLKGYESLKIVQDGLLGEKDNVMLVKGAEGGAKAYRGEGETLVPGKREQYIIAFPEGASNIRVDKKNTQS